MTRQILLKTPRGKTAVVSVDELQQAIANATAGATTTSSTSSAGAVAVTGLAAHAAPEAVRDVRHRVLLQHLIDASKRRDVGESDGGAFQRIGSSNSSNSNNDDIGNKTNRKRTIQDIAREEEEDKETDGVAGCLHVDHAYQQQQSPQQPQPLHRCCYYPEIDGANCSFYLEDLVVEDCRNTGFGDDIEMVSLEDDDEQDGESEIEYVTRDHPHEALRFDGSYSEQSTSINTFNNKSIIPSIDEEVVSSVTSRLQQNFRSLSLSQSIQTTSPFLSSSALASASSSSSSPPLFSIYHEGRQLSLETLWEWIHYEHRPTHDDGVDHDDHRAVVESDEETKFKNCGVVECDDEDDCMVDKTDVEDSGAPRLSCKGMMNTRNKKFEKTESWQSSSLSSSKASCPRFPLYLTLNTSIRVLGGIDRQNRVGSKFGGGGVSSAQQSERERKERLKQLALESIDLAKDPYLMRNHLGTYECKLCLTLHPNEANYLAHTQGKKHQQNLSKRAHIEKQRQERLAEQEAAEGGGMKKPPSAAGDVQQPPSKVLKIGRPAYQVFKSRDPDTNQRCLTFELLYPQIHDGYQPRHRFVSAFEQKVELHDRRYQYLLLAAQPYETVAFKIPNEPLDQEPGRFITFWDTDEKKFTLTLYFQEPNKTEAVTAAENDDVKTG